MAKNNGKRGKLGISGAASWQKPEKPTVSVKKLNPYRGTRGKKLKIKNVYFAKNTYKSRVKLISCEKYTIKHGNY